jgi:excisionase family DNA binding protein
MLAPPPKSPTTALIDGLLRLDTPGVCAQLEGLVAEGMPLAEIVSRVLLPAWSELSERCEQGELGAAELAAAAGSARAGLARAGRRAGTPPGMETAGRVVLVAPAGSVALLWAELLGDVAACAGWATEVLCAPQADELAATGARAQPVAVVVSAADAAGLPLLADAVDAAHGAGAPVLAWGPAFGDDGQRAQTLGADGWAADLDGALDLLGAWARRRPAPGAAPRLAEPYAELVALRPALLAAAAGVGGTDAAASAWVGRAAAALVDNLTAAVALGDPRILAEHLERERRGTDQSGRRDVQLVGLVDAVAAAVPLTSVVARQYIFTSREELRRRLVGAATQPKARPTPGGTGVEGPPSGPTPAAVNGTGQVFADVLLLAALSCQAPVALLSVPQVAGTWSTLSHGVEDRVGLNDNRFFDLVASSDGPVEIADLAAHPELSRTPLAQAPHQLRWALAVPLRHVDGTVLGVVAVLDRWLREPGRREHRAMQAVARLAAAKLAGLRKPSPAPSPSPSPRAEPRPADLAVVGSRTTRHDPLEGLRRTGSSQEPQQLLRSHEVAVLFDVTERTVINWAAAGKLPSLRTIGGHLRFRRSDVLDLLAGRSRAAGD